MKKTIFAALFLTLVIPAHAVGTVAVYPLAQDQAGAFSDEEKRQALEALKNIANAFGDVKAPQPKEQKAEEKSDHKTVGDVADKALDISTKYIGQAVGVIEKAAPHVWRVMVMQQYAKAIGDIVAPFLWIIMIVIAATVARKFWLEPDDMEYVRKNHMRTSDEHDFRAFLTIIVPIAGCLIAGGFFVYNLSQSAMYLINPEYYAIKDLVTLLLHPGSM